MNESRRSRSSVSHGRPQVLKKLKAFGRETAPAALGSPAAVGVSGPPFSPQKPLPKPTSQSSWGAWPLKPALGQDLTFLRSHPVSTQLSAPASSGLPPWLGRCFPAPRSTRLCPRQPCSKCQPLITRRESLEWKGRRRGRRDERSHAEADCPFRLLGFSFSS